MMNYKPSGAIFVLKVPLKPNSSQYSCAVQSFWYMILRTHVSQFLSGRSCRRAVKFCCICVMMQKYIKLVNTMKSLFDRLY